MKFLTIHADYIEYEMKKKAINNAEEVSEDNRKRKVEECVVVFSSVEESDALDSEYAAKRFVKEIKDIAGQLNTEKIVLYPYAHLSNNLAKGDTPVKVLDKAKEMLEEEGYEVYKSPFGWYKAFSISCKGHPLSELSRGFNIEEDVEGKTGSVENVESESMKQEDELVKTYWVMTPDGEMVKAEEFDYSPYPSLQKLYDYEVAGTRTNKKEPPHIDMMKKHQLVDYEPGSDSGNLRWYPKGLCIKKLLEEHVTNMLLKSGAMQVETPIMYDYEHPALGKYLHRFPARQYVVLSDEKKYFLRFAACFGQYLMKHDMQISYKNLPLKLYELTHYSFRREQKGEIAGLKRLRSFTMPDMHTLCKDMDMAVEEFKKQYLLSMKFLQDLNMDFDCICRFQEDFLKENFEFAKDLVRFIGKPMMIEQYNRRYAYFVMKFEFSVNDALDKAATLSTVQIDVENTERFDIKYTDKDGQEKYPYMLHASISGGIDRDLYALLETESLKAQQGKKPSYPLWLAPTQVRIVPVSVEKHLEYSEKISEVLEKANIRVDIDDHEDSVSKRIRNAGKEWVPYTLVIGDEELESGKVKVNIRGEEEPKIMVIEELVSLIKDKIDGYPVRPIPEPKYLSKRAIFFSGR